MEDKHYDKNFWFVVGLVSFGLLYVVVLTFIPIPKENVRFADTSIGWVQGSIVTYAVSYLLGGNPTKQKTTTEVTETATKITDEKNQI